VDPFVVVAAGRCAFTTDGLLAVADLVDRFRARRCKVSLGLATGHVLTSGLASSRETMAVWPSHLNWLFSGNAVEKAKERSCLLQKLSQIRANLLRCQRSR
jgi:hypothetical protein